MPDKKLEGRVALITGASRGIGAAVARRFAAEGAHVVLAARTVGGLEAVDDAIRREGGTATLVPIDLREEELIAGLAQAVAERFGLLDILVGNGAILGDLTPVAHMESAMWERVMQVNVTANMHLIRYFDPLLKKSNAPRAMFVSSGVVGRNQAFWGAYTASKAALEALIFTYASEVANSALRVNIIDPGRVRTGMRAAAFPGEDPNTLRAPEEITNLFVELAGTACTHHGGRFYAQG